MYKITKRVYIGFLNLAEQSMYFKSFLNGDNANKSTIKKKQKGSIKKHCLNETR